MRKFLVIAMAAATITGCSKNEDGRGDSSPQQPLNVLTSVNTKAPVEGNGLPQNSVIGVHVVEDATPTTVYSGASAGTGGNLSDGQNVRFTNVSGVNTWEALDATSGNPARLVLNNTLGRVYAYYPYAPTVTGIGDAATIPVGIQATGEIDALLAPVKSSADFYAIALGYENDYLYEASATRATVSSTTTSTAPLSFNHAMARVSFLLYTGFGAPTVSGLDDDKYYLESFTIKNKSGKSQFQANGTVTMTISNGTLTGVTSGGEVSRTVKNYAMVRSTAEGETENTTAINASKAVSCLVYPHASFTSATLNGKDIIDGMEVVFGIKKSTNGEITYYAVPLPVTAGTSDKWLAGNNYTYTVKLSGAALSIETVQVTKWNDIVGGDIEIE